MTSFRCSNFLKEGCLVSTVPATDMDVGEKHCLARSSMSIGFLMLSNLIILCSPSVQDRNGKGHFPNGFVCSEYCLSVYMKMFGLEYSGYRPFESIRGARSSGTTTGGLKNSLRPATLVIVRKKLGGKRKNP